MKKTQRARLADLTAKAEAARSPEEKAELTFLSALATLHPDASKDVDDSSPASAVNATQPPTVTASPAAGANAPPVAGQTGSPATLRGFLQSLRTGAATGADLVAARQSVATLTGERDQARTQVTTLTGQVTALNGQLGAFAAFFGLTAAELAGKDGPAITALLQQKISAEAIEQVAGMGLPTGSLPPQSKSEGAETPAELLNKYNAIADPNARADFYEKHKTAMFGGKS